MRRQVVQHDVRVGMAWHVKIDQLEEREHVHTRMTTPRVVQHLTGGDEVMTLRNDARLGVRNGTRVVNDRVDLDQRTMTVAFSTGERATLPPDYLDARYLAHAYASTVHKAQEMTCDRAFLLATDDLYQELG